MLHHLCLTQARNCSCVFRVHPWSTIYPVYFVPQGGHESRMSDGPLAGKRLANSWQKKGKERNPNLDWRASKLDA